MHACQSSSERCGNAGATTQDILNAVGGIEIPFSFEGDGSFVCVPDRVLVATQAALAQTRVMAREAFGLDLRIATIPVSDIAANGFSVLLARYRVSEHYVQAVFSGGGVAFAESLMKDDATAGRYEVPPGVEPRGSFDGAVRLRQSLRT